MAEPRGSLTAAQYEIMEAVWNVQDAGATVADIWQGIAASRDIGRTTRVGGLTNDVHDWHGCLRRNARDSAPHELIEHHVANH